MTVWDYFHFLCFTSYYGNIRISIGFDGPDEPEKSDILQKPNLIKENHHPMGVGEHFGKSNFRSSSSSPSHREYVIPRELWDLFARHMIPTTLQGKSTNQTSKSFIEKLTSTTTLDRVGICPVNIPYSVNGKFGGTILFPGLSRNSPLYPFTILSQMWIFIQKSQKSQKSVKIHYP